MNKSILVIGGAGYIGAHTNLALVEKGYNTVVLDNLVYGHREFVQSGTFIFGNTMDSELISSILRKYEIEAVIYFAAYAYVGESVKDPNKYYLNNVAATLNVLNAMINENVDKFIFSSTCATYGNPVEIPITESHPQVPINPYGRSKLMVENIIKDYMSAYGLRYVSLRYFNAAGADQHERIGEWHVPETHLIPLLLDCALDNRTMQIFGSDYNTIDGTCIRDYIHVTDLAAAHVLSLEYLINGGESIFLNLGNGKGYSIKQVIDSVKKISEKDIQIEYVDRRIGDPAILVGSAEKAKNVLGWVPEHSELDNILKTAWNWQKQLKKKLEKGK